MKFGYVSFKLLVLCHLNKCPQPKDVELSNKGKKKAKNMVMSRKEFKICVAEL